VFHIDPYFSTSQPIASHIGGLFDAVPGVIFFILDPRGRIVAANSAMLASRGLSDPRSLFGKPDSLLAPADTRTLNAGGTVKRVEFINGLEGLAGWFNTTLSPVINEGKLIGITGLRFRVSMPSREDKDKAFSRLAPAIRHLEGHFHTRLKMEELAILCGFSVVQFTRVFTATFQIPPKRFLISLRVERAQHLLATTSRSISAISAETGFFDQSHFTRIFGQMAGVTPLAYRKRFLT
jgi:AraC-like DNA-binding protein